MQGPPGGRLMEGTYMVIYSNPLPVADVREGPGLNRTHFDGQNLSSLWIMEIIP